ncbi:MAG TPA: endonuclease/exonuclease/phosphatase family protein, partial [Thermohalobaculum sp.]|nr:endonuclease/exonuclease/phosphatase family protein [Thermohalobaculum sp.]
LEGLDYPHRFHAPVNTGVPSGHDLDGDGRQAGPDDAFGWGRFPGQYGMALLSRLPVDRAAARSFRLFRWAALPGADRPATADGPHHDDAVWDALRLSSKSHWDVPVALPDGGRLHVLALHPTPPVFDGPEDLNGRRNADEIRLLIGLIDGAGWLEDDAGRRGGLPAEARFVVMGDLNADPHRGEARRAPLEALLAHPRVQDPHPASAGAVAGPRAAAGPRADEVTADFGTDPGPGRLRVDYVLPSAGLEVTGAGVFWPPPGDPLARLVGDGDAVVSSDHRLVWVDIRP